VEVVERASATEAGAEEAIRALRREIKYEHFLFIGFLLRAG